MEQFRFQDDHSPVYDYTRFDVDSPAGSRRSIYRFLVRSVPDPFMEALDCADPSLLVPTRSVTQTALQSLATWNNPFVVRQAEHFASRLSRGSVGLEGQIELAYRLALDREPSSEELEEMIHHAREHGLASACRVLFNTSEFFFID